MGTYPNLSKRIQTLSNPANSHLVVLVELGVIDKTFVSILHMGSVEIEGPKRCHGNIMATVSGIISISFKSSLQFNSLRRGGWESFDSTTTHFGQNSHFSF
jgi:hypothetical protein